MITLHHLNRSRSKRIIWLLEELGQPYQIKSYLRDPQSQFAPPELLAVHPLGNSPVVEVDGQVLPESGAITEYLIDRFAPETLAPARDHQDYGQYLYWIHFAESSAMLPLLLRIFVDMDASPTRFLSDYADSERDKVIGHLENALAERQYLVGDRLTGADIMMSFVVELVAQGGLFDRYPNIQAYYQRLAGHPGFQAAEKAEAEHG